MKGEDTNEMKLLSRHIKSEKYYVKQDGGYE